MNYFKAYIIVALFYASTGLAFAEEVEDCCGFTKPTEPFHGLSEPLFNNVRFEVIVHNNVQGPCLYWKPPTTPTGSPTCAAVTSVKKVWDCNACEKTDDFSAAHKSAIIASEDSYLGPNAERISDPSAKQDCHGATLGMQYRVHSILDFVAIQGKVETSDWQEAEFATHGDPVSHSSYVIEWGSIPVMGCNGQIEPKPTVMFTSKFTYGSTLKMPDTEIMVQYPGTIKYYKSP